MSGSGRGRPVYSSEHGRVGPSRVEGGAGREAGAGQKEDGVVRVRREVKGRRGKTVTTIAGLQLDPTGLRAVAKQLKQRCGAGGSVKRGVIELQGDHRDAVVEELRRQGYTAKPAGG